MGRLKKAKRYEVLRMDTRLLLRLRLMPYFEKKVKRNMKKWTATMV